MRDGQDSLGGEFAWATGLSVFAPVPGREHWPLRLHGFLNVGRVAGYDRCKPLTTLQIWMSVLMSSAVICGECRKLVL